MSLHLSVLDPMYILGNTSGYRKKTCGKSVGVPELPHSPMSSESQKSVLTIQNVANPRSRSSKQDSYVPKKRTAEEKEKSAEKRAEMQKDVDSVLDLLNEKVEELAERYQKKSAFFSNWIFHGGAKMVSSRNSSPWNAWKSMKMRELKEEGAL